jgi:hypothetical protein
MAEAKSAAAERMARHRERKAAGIIVIQDLQLTRSGVEGLIAKGLLGEEASNDPAEVRAALVKLLNETLAPPPQPRRQIGGHISALRSIAFGLF